jgi:hypothetical protein
MLRIGRERKLTVEMVWDSKITIPTYDDRISLIESLRWWPLLRFRDQISGCGFRRGILHMNGLDMQPWYSMCRMKGVYVSLEDVHGGVHDLGYRCGWGLRMGMHT